MNLNKRSMVTKRHLSRDTSSVGDPDRYNLEQDHGGTGPDPDFSGCDEFAVKQRMRWHRQPEEKQFYILPAKKNLDELLLVLVRQDWLK